MINYIEKLKQKCNISSDLIEIIEQIFERLLHFGYITKAQEKKLRKKLYDNIDVVITGDNAKIDFKSGYYDAMKKELYIKDIDNIESVYLRILYILSTCEISKEIYSVGYSITALSTENYKIVHKYFGINRAVISNLVCRLLYTIPTALSIVPTYRTYENDFIGNKLDSDNDIYFLEGKLLQQICYIYDINEEQLYINLFSNSPKKQLDKILRKINNENKLNMLNILDEISRMYSNYNKLCYFNVLLNKNYLEIKRNILNDNVNELKQQQAKIKLSIKTALDKLNPETEVLEEQLNELENNIDSSLAEKIYSLEENILIKIEIIQNILVDYLISNETNYSDIAYAIKLKELEKMIIIKNDRLKESIYTCINTKLLNTFESTASNLIEKIKYSIVSEILSNDKYIKIYKDLAFKRISLEKNSENSALVALCINNSFLQLVEINDLDKKSRELEKNTNSIQLKNLRYLLNTPSSNTSIRKIEKIYSMLKSKYTKLNNLRIDDFYLFSLNNKNYIICVLLEDFLVIELKLDKNNEFAFKQLKLSENYTLFNLRQNSLPVLYNKKESGIKRFLSFFSIFG